MSAPICSCNADNRYGPQPGLYPAALATLRRDCAEHGGRLPTAFAFRDLTLAEAEGEIVGAAIDHEPALLTALGILPLDFFRSEYADDLRRIFYVVVGWYAKGEWSPETNRDRLALYFPDVWIDGLWCPSGVVPEYVRDLCAAVVESNRLADDAVAAARAWRESNPLLPSDRAAAKPAPARQGSSAKKQAPVKELGESFLESQRWS